MNEAVSRHRHVGTDTAWGMKLKLCMDTVARQFQVAVISAKPVQSFDESDTRDMRFEVQTANGELDVIYSRGGEFEFQWK
jgi:hypothetical protein